MTTATAPLGTQMSLAMTNAGSEPLRLGVSCMVFITAALALVLPSGYSYGPALMLLVGLPVLLYRRPQVSLVVEDKWLMAALIFALVVGVGLNLAYQLSSRYYELPSRYLLALVIMWLMLAYPPRSGFWWAGLIAGTIGGGLLALWQVTVSEYVRAEGFMISIQFGNVNLMMGMLCLAGIGWVQKRPGAAYWIAALIIAAAFGVLGSLLSGTRGGWLALPVALTVLYMGYRKHIPRRLLSVSLLVVAVVMAGLFLVPESKVQERVINVGVEFDQYLDGEPAPSSLGLRLQMWQSALPLIAQRPLLGWGDNGYREAMLELIDDAETAQRIGQFDHVHNEILDNLLKKGLLGLLGLLAVYLVPLVIFARYLATARGGNNPSVRAYALSGLLLVLCVIVFGFSQAFLLHNSGVTIYVVMLTIVWGLLRAAARRFEEDAGDDS